jgi:hypothetical protein
MIDAEAAGGGFSPLLYVSMQSILGVAYAYGASSSKDYVQASPYLSILDYLIAGYTGNGNNSRVRIGFKPHN